MSPQIFPNWKTLELTIFMKAKKLFKISDILHNITISGIFFRIFSWYIFSISLSLAIYQITVGGLG